MKLKLNKVQLGMLVVFVISLSSMAYMNLFYMGIINSQQNDLKAMGSYILDLEKSNDKLIGLLKREYNVNALDPSAYLEVIQYRGSSIVGYYVHVATLTNTGREFYNHKIGNSAYANATKYSNHIGVSNDATAPDVADTRLTDEIASNGLTRALATFTDTGLGTYNMTYTFSVTGTQSVQKYGEYWDLTGHNLVWEDTSSVKNLVSGDTLKVTFMHTDAQA